MRAKINFAVTVCSMCMVAACSSGAGKAKVVTITVPPSRPATASSGATAGAASSSSASPTTLRKLAGTCDSLLPDYAVTQALGGTQLTGDDSFVVGEPDPSIGRLAYLNCRYGVTGTGDAAKAKVEIGVSLYSTPAKASDRVAATADDYIAHGATAADVVVDGRAGRLLTGGDGDGYDLPLLAVASEQRTVAVDLDPSVAAGDGAVTKATKALAVLALRKTGG